MALVCECFIVFLSLIMGKRCCAIGMDNGMSRVVCAMPEALERENKICFLLAQIQWKIQ